MRLIKRIKNITVFCVVFIFLFISAYSRLVAQSISITPTNFRIIAQPGESIVKEFRLRNSGSERSRYTLEVADAYGSSELGGLEHTPPDPSKPYSLATWFSYDVDEIVLEPQEAIDINVTIKIPETAEPGGHYGTVFVVGKSAPSDVEIASGLGGTQITQIPRLAVNFILTVAGDFKYGGELISFEGPQFVQSGPVDFVIRFKNTGSIHQNPKGQITFYDLFNRKVGTVDIPAKFIFPNMIRQMDASWNRVFLLGRYRAVAEIQHGENYTEIETAELTFWALPWMVILGGILIIAAFIALGRLTARRGINHVPEPKDNDDDQSKDTETELESNELKAQNAKGKATT